MTDELNEHHYLALEYAAGGGGMPRVDEPEVVAAYRKLAAEGLLVEFGQRGERHTFIITDRGRLVWSLMKQAEARGVEYGELKATMEFATND